MNRSWMIAAMLLFLAGKAGGTEWKVFCIPAKHVDVGFNYLPAEAQEEGYPGSVEDFHNVITIRALLVRSLTAKYPPEARYRWFFDAAWQLEQMQKYLPKRMDEIRWLINSGQFGYNPLHAHYHSMYLTNEQLMRSMSYARSLEEQGFRRSRVAVHSDVPTVGWGYASMLASAGVKYFLKGTWYNSPYSRNLAEVAPAPLFRWTGPDGQQVLCFYYDGYAVMAHGAGLGRRHDSLTEQAVMDCVRRYEKLAAEGKWPYDAFPMFGSEGDWGIPDRRNSDFIRDWNGSHPDIQLRMATPEEFFAYIETNFADQIPDGGPGGWGISYDLVEGNAVKSGARARATDHVLKAAEAFGALAHVRLGTPYPAEALREAWAKQLLYHEHSFGMRDATGPEGRRQYAWKTRLTEQSARLGQKALDAALMALAAEISNQGEERIAVFNSLSFARSDTVEMEIEGDPAADVKLVEVPSGRAVPCRTSLDGGKTHVVFWADDVPSLGYRSYRIVRGATLPVGQASGLPSPENSQAGSLRHVVADAAVRTLENEFYRLTLAADGSMASLFDKQLQRELVDPQAAYRGNQFIFKDHAWTDASPRTVEIRAVDLGAVGAGLEVRAEPTAIFSAITTRYTLHHGLKRLEIENRFTKQPGKSASNETVFYAFPFAVPQGKFCLDIPGVVARYPEDFRPETDWSIMPAQSFAAVANADISVLVATREAPNFEFSAMRKFFDHPTQPDLSTTTIFAQPLTKQSVNKDDYDLEGGDYVFQYAITSLDGPFDASKAVRLAADFQRGLSPVMLTRRDGSLPSETSFVDIGSDQLVLSALKQADDGRGLILRIWNPTGDKQTAKLTFPAARMISATATDVLERDLDLVYQVRDQAASVPCGPKQFVTLRVMFTPEVVP